MATKKSKADKLDQETLEYISDLTAVLKTRSGRAVLYSILDNAGLCAQSFVPLDSRMTDFNEGRRSVSFDLARDINSVSPDLVAKMMIEFTTGEE